MREIKFRAYNRCWNMTLPVDEIKFENGEAVSVIVTIKASDYDHKGEWADYIVGDEITIEQFTGLKDKNGKEIYEGDIIEYKDKGNLMDSGIYEIEWNENSTGFEPLKDLDGKTYNYPREWWIDKTVKVIGNIHENPELLNK